MYFGTLLALALIIVVHFFGIPLDSSPPQWLNWPTAITLLFLMAQLMITTLSMRPLQKAAETSSDKLIGLYRGDNWQRLSYIILVTCLLICLFGLVSPTFVSYFGKIWYFLEWLAVGVGADVLYHSTQRTLNYLEQETILEKFAHAAQTSLVKDREKDLCGWVDTFTECGNKAIEKGQTGNALGTIRELGNILQIFFLDVKSIAHRTHDAQSEALGIQDKVGFTLFYVLERLELLFKKGWEAANELICSSIITTLGKIACYAASCDFSLVSQPAYLIGKLSRQAIGRWPDLALKGTITLLESLRLIINDNDLTYMELQEPILTIVSQLDEIGKETFRNNKKASLPMLMQPLADLKEMLLVGKLKEHRDTPALVAIIDSKLAEWETLATVMRTMPTISIESTETPETSTASE